MQPEWVPDGVDFEKPSTARIYDYLLGGYHNFAVDRAVAQQLVAAMPDIALQASANRAFLHRAVRYLVNAGIDQFIDIGSGIPTLGNVHEIAQEIVPSARIVYVDIDPVAVTHARHLLADNAHATVIREDLRRPDRMLANEELRSLLDLRRPVALLAVAVLHAIGDADDPAGIVATYRDALASGSHMAIAHGVDTRATYSEHLVGISQQTNTPLTFRSPDRVRAMFDGFELVEPGVTWAPLWRPDSPYEVPERPELSANMVGVGRKR